MIETKVIPPTLWLGDRCGIIVPYPLQPPTVCIRHVPYVGAVCTLVRHSFLTLLCNTQPFWLPPFLFCPPIVDREITTEESFEGVRLPVGWYIKVPTPGVVPIRRARLGVFALKQHRQVRGCARAAVGQVRLDHDPLFFSELVDALRNVLNRCVFSFRKPLTLAGFPCFPTPRAVQRTASVSRFMGCCNLVLDRSGIIRRVGWLFDWKVPGLESQRLHRDVVPATVSVVIHHPTESGCIECRIVCLFLEPTCIVAMIRIKHLPLFHIAAVELRAAAQAGQSPKRRGRLRQSRTGGQCISQRGRWDHPRQVCAARQSENHHDNEPLDVTVWDLAGQREVAQIVVSGQYAIAEVVTDLQPAMVALNAEGRSPCLAAAQLANLEGLRALLEFGADCEVATANGITPCAVATSSAHPLTASRQRATSDARIRGGRPSRSSPQQ